MVASEHPSKLTRLPFQHGRFMVLLCFYTEIGLKGPESERFTEHHFFFRMEEHFDVLRVDLATFERRGKLFKIKKQKRLLLILNRLFKTEFLFHHFVELSQLAMSRLFNLSISLIVY